MKRIRGRLDLERTVGEAVAFYPPIEPYRTGRLRVSDLHEIYFEEVGNPDGKPAVLLHGGPGGGITPLYRQVFDPEKYRVILFDQRGCGQSTPMGELSENTTWDIVSDIEKLREHLNINRWLVFGGSWGATLGLAYAQKHPDKVTEMVLRGVWLSRQSEIDFDCKQGCNWVFPEAWDQFIGHIPEDERGDLVEAYFQRLSSKDEQVRLAACKAWGDWEACKFSLVSNPQMIEENASSYDQALALLECQYVRNRCWLERDNQLLEDAHLISHIPAIIVFGRYDLITPVASGWELKKVWPKAELIVIPDAGHSFDEPGIAEALVKATDYFVEAYAAK